MSQTVNLILPNPPSANRYWRTVNGKKGFPVTYVSEEARAYKREIEEIAGIDVPMYSEVEMTVKWFRQIRSGDLDNRLKVLIDALKGVAYADDGQIRKITAERFEDPHRPRVEVEITALGLM